MKAAIDIGSNTILLLVAELQNGKVKPIREQQRAPRLGKGVDAEKNLSEDAMQQAIEILSEYKAIIKTEYPGVDQVRLLATSAVRDANNRDEFVTQIVNETAWQVQILDGSREAELTFLGAQSVIEAIDEPVVVIDVGGGSTEVAGGSQSRMWNRHSFNMGSVRFTERYLSGNPPGDGEIQHCRSQIRKMLEDRGFELPHKSSLIGVSGTVTSMAAIGLNHQNYQPQKLNNLVCKQRDLFGLIRQFSRLTPAEMLKAHPNILKGRADVFLAGLIILHEFMLFYNFGELLVSTGGIRHGSLLAQ